MKKYLFIFCFLISIISCTEPYDFGINKVIDAIVVDGLITDQAEVYKIKLHTASGYGNTTNMPVTQATINISDDAGNVYPFNEDAYNPGVYISNPYQFIGQSGHSYTLHIHTSSGNDFESSPQLLLPSQKIDSVYGEKSFEYNVSVDADGNYISFKAEGITVDLDIRNRNEGNQNYRLINSVYLQYTYQYAVPFAPFVYGWTKYTGPIPGDGMCLISNFDGTSTNDITKLKFTFIPFDKSFYRIIDIANMQKFTLLIQQFRMNDETNEYFKEIEKQLKAEGRLFDPISTQLNGNITCLNDHTLQAFGFFEASSKISYVYTDESYNWVLRPIFKLRPVNLDNIPDNGTSSGVVPPFWIY
jgi:hypothetical protein